MTKVRIRQVASRTRWQLVTFYGKARGESVGVVDMLAIRKDHGAPEVGYYDVLSCKAIPCTSIARSPYELRDNALLRNFWLVSP